MGGQEVQSIVDMVKETNPALIEEVIPKLISIGDLQGSCKLLRRNPHKGHGDHY